MIKEELSDEDLLALIDAGSKSAEDALYNRYYAESVRAGKNYAKLYRHLGISEEEYTAVAFSKVYDALRSYKNVRINFRSFWHVLVRNAVFDLINHSDYQVSVKYDKNVSLDDQAYISSDEVLLSDVIGEDEDKGDDDLYTNIANIINNKENDLTDEERKVARLAFILGYKRRDMLEILDTNKDHLSYVLKVVRKKIIKILKDSYL